MQLVQELDKQPNDRLDWLLSKDLRASASAMSVRQVRYIVDTYYQIQRDRIGADNMVRSCGESEPSNLIAWFADRYAKLESVIPPAMRVYALARRDGRWALSIHGIGPILAAGLLANVDIERAPTVGHIWSFAGLNPEMKWGKGQKRPFSLKMKVLCWKLGQSFMKLRAGEADVYGEVYERRKALEVERNEAGANAGYELKGYPEWRKKIGIPSGPVPSLPPGIIDARARRYAVKLFLSHLHHVMYECRYGTPLPKPYILNQPGHVHFLVPPNWPCE